MDIKITRLQNRKFSDEVPEGRVTLRDRIRSEDVMKKLQTGNVVGYQAISKEMAKTRGTRLLNVYHGKHTPCGRRELISDFGRPRTRWTLQFK
jgi:hypothetical protein